MIRALAIVAVGCGGGGSSPATAGSATPGPEHAAAAERAWRAGDLDAAIRELEQAPGPLLVRAYDLAGRSGAARRTAATLGALELHVIPDVTKVEEAVVSPDGAYVATIERDSTRGARVIVWDVMTGRDTFATTLRGASVGFGADANGHMLVAIVDHEARTVRVADAATGTMRWQHETAKPYALAIDRRGVLTTLHANRTLVQWPLDTGDKLRTIPLEFDAATLEVDAAGKTALVAETVVELATGRKLGALPGATYGSGIVDMRLAPDGETVAVSRKDQTVELYNVDGKLRTTLEHAGSQVTFLDDSTLLASDGVAALARWSSTGKQLATHALPADVHAFSYPRSAFPPRLFVGAGGHVVARRGSGIAVVRIADKAVVLGELGAPTRATALAWSPDGSKLAAADTDTRIVVWTLAGGALLATTTSDGAFGLDASGKVVPSKPDFELYQTRVFIRAGDQVVRFVEATGAVVTAAIGGHRLVTADGAGAVAVWNADTGEGLGEIASRGAVSALAVAPDGTKLAVARDLGGIELWDLPSRTLLLTAAIASDGWFVASASGKADGDPRGIPWRVGAVAIAAADLPLERGLAAAALAHPPPPIAIAPTPAPALAARGCIPRDREPGSSFVALDGTRLTWCLSESGEAPYCFGGDVVTGTLAPVPPPVQAIAPVHERDHNYARTERTDDGKLRICPHGDDCHDTAIAVADGAHSAVSDDGQLVAMMVGDDTTVETWDVAAVKRIARFRVRYGTAGHRDGAHVLGFWGHDLLADAIPCAGPCGTATLYDVTGKELGPFAAESTMFGAERFHDDLWIVSSGDSGLAIQDIKTGRIAGRVDSTEWSGYAVTPERVALGVGHGTKAKRRGEGAVALREPHRERGDVLRGQRLERARQLVEGDVDADHGAPRLEVKARIERRGAIVEDARVVFVTAGGRDVAERGGDLAEPRAGRAVARLADVLRALEIFACVVEPAGLEQGLGAIEQARRDRAVVAGEHRGAQREAVVVTRERVADAAARAIDGGELVEVDREARMAVAERGPRVGQRALEQRRGGAGIAGGELDGAEIHLEQRALIAAQRIGGRERLLQPLARRPELTGLAQGLADDTVELGAVAPGARRGGVREAGPLDDVRRIAGEQLLAQDAGPHVELERGDVRARRGLERTRERGPGGRRGAGARLDGAGEHEQLRAQRGRVQIGGARVDRGDLGARVGVATEHVTGPRAIDIGLGGERARAPRRIGRQRELVRIADVLAPRGLRQLGDRGGDLIAVGGAAAALRDQRVEARPRAIETAHAQLEQRVGLLASHARRLAHAARARLPRRCGGVEGGDRRRRPPGVAELRAQPRAVAGRPAGHAPAAAQLRARRGARERERAEADRDDRRRRDDRHQLAPAIALELADELAERREPRARLRGHRARDHRAQPRGRARLAGARHLRRLDKLGARGAGVRPLAVQRLVTGHAEAELIRGRGRDAAGEHLGRHVQRRAGAATVVVAREVLRDAEIDDAHAIVADDDVVGLDVAVDEAGPMRGREPGARFAHHPHDVAPRPARADPRAQRYADDELHHHHHRAVALVDVVHRDDVGMRELGERARLPLHISTRVQHLDRDLAIEPRVIRREHGAHRAAADPIEQHEPAQARRVIAAEQAGLDLRLQQLVGEIAHRATIRRCRPTSSSSTRGAPATWRPATSWCRGTGRASRASFARRSATMAPI
jgi:WD40 repeat protein